ncbi:MAG: 30S ribosome-binding factor RbfA [Deltaproteobacteria bacterium]|nr:30S ribosome-binding factor RbfA [Deltaproteobacteria bacterium]
MSIRTQRVGEEIRKIISERLIRGLYDPMPGFVTIREVEVNSDFSLAKVFYSVIGSDEDKEGAKEVFKKSRGQLRSEVGKKVRLRNTPALVFVLDESGERAARIHDLLRENAPADDSDDDASES